MQFSRRLLQLLPFIFFLLISIGIHLYFFMADSLFTARGGDSIDQYLLFHSFLHDLYSNGNFEWSWEYGLGGDVFGQFIYYYATSLFFWLSLFVKGHSIVAIIQAKFILSLLKSFLSLALMYLLLRYHKRSMSSAIVGALIYIGSVFFAKYSLRSDFMSDAMVWLPLVILSFDRFVDQQKRGLFIFSIFLIAASNFYFAFITSVYIFTYSLLKYVLVHHELKIKSFLHYYIKLGIHYGTGLLLSSFSFLPAVYHFLHADRFSKDYDIPWLFPGDYYKNLYYDLFFSVSDLTFPVICIGLLILGFSMKNKEVRTRMIFSAIIIIFYLLPITSSFFNGLSAIQFRWFYLVIFTIALMIPFILDGLYEERKRLSVLFLFVVGLVFLSLKLKSTIVNRYVEHDETINFIILTAGSLLLLVRPWLPKVLVQASILSIFSVNVLFNNFVFFTNELGPYRNQKAINDSLFGSNGLDKASEQEVIHYIKEHDSSFYRVMWKDVSQYNLPMLYHYNGFSAYHSLIPYNVSKFMKEKYTTLQFDSPSLFKNLDQRLYLETALSTKYYILSNKDSFKPFGYKKIKSFKDYTIFQNQYSLPLASMSYQGIQEKDFNSLNYSERDRLLLHAVVTTDKPKAYGLDNYPQHQMKETVLQNGLKNISLHEISRTKDSFVVGRNGYMDIPITSPKEPGELLMEINIRSTKGEQFELQANGKKLVKREEKSTYAYPQTTFVLNLGNTQGSDSVQLSLSPGEYTIKQLKFTFTSYRDYAEAVNQQQGRALKNLKVTSDSVRGVANTSQQGVLTTSIPFSKGWQAFVDGQRVKTFEINSTFVGIEVPKGKHQIELTYRSPYVKEGLWISIVTLCILFLLRLSRINGH